MKKIKTLMAAGLFACVFATVAAAESQSGNTPQARGVALGISLAEVRNIAQSCNGILQKSPYPPANLNSAFTHDRVNPVPAAAQYMIFEKNSMIGGPDDPFSGAGDLYQLPALPNQGMAAYKQLAYIGLDSSDRVVRFAFSLEFVNAVGVSADALIKQLSAAWNIRFRQVQQAQQTWNGGMTPAIYVSSNPDKGFQVVVSTAYNTWGTIEVIAIENPDSKQIQL